jgi:hypothetical protein
LSPRPDAPIIGARHTRENRPQRIGASPGHGCPQTGTRGSTGGRARRAATRKPFPRPRRPGISSEPPRRRRPGISNEPSRRLRIFNEPLRPRPGILNEHRIRGKRPRNPEFRRAAQEHHPPYTPTWGISESTNVPETWTGTLGPDAGDLRITAGRLPTRRCLDATPWTGRASDG